MRICECQQLALNMYSLVCIDAQGKIQRSNRRAWMSLCFPAIISNVPLTMDKIMRMYVTEFFRYHGII